MGYTEPRKTLASVKPVSRVLSLPLILSLLLQIAVVIVFQVWNAQRDLLGSGGTLSGPVVGGHEKGHLWVVVTGPLRLLGASSHFIAVPQGNGLKLRGAALTGAALCGCCRLLCCVPSITSPGTHQQLDLLTCELIERLRHQWSTC